jgi:hypothetical protein
MRACTLTLAAAIAAVVAPTAVRADDPPVVFQTRPLGPLIKSIQEQSKWFPEGTFTAKGMGAKPKLTVEQIFSTLLDDKKSGLDLTRPLVGYVLIPADPKNSAPVFAVPVADEKTFTAFLKDPGETEVRPLGDGLVELIARRADGEPGKKDERVLGRFHQKHFYIATGKDPTAALDPKGLVAPEKLYDPAEKADVAARVVFDRLPREVREQAAQAVKKGMDDLHRSFAGADLGPDGRKAVEPLVKMIDRYAGQIGEAQEAVGRYTVDTATGELAVEAVLVAKPGTSLAADIAGRKPTTNLFAGLTTTADTAAGLRLRLPFTNDELKAAGVAGLGILKDRATADANPAVQPIAVEAIDGAIRTVKTGEFDIAAALRGPDKDGRVTAVLAVAFDDPSKLEEQIKGLVKMIPPVAERVKFAAAKVGSVEIHEIAIGDQLPPEAQKLFGDNATAALAFAPKGIFFAAGPDAVATLKTAVAVRPAAAPMLDVVANPARMTRIAEATGGKDAAAKALGTADRLSPVVSLSVAGGKDLTVRVGMNLKFFFGLAAQTNVGASKPAPKKE